MTNLRTAAQQALEALKMMRDEYGEANCPACDHADAAIYALKEALVEDAMQKFTDVNQEIEAALGCDHCNSPLYAAIRCRVCGRVAEPVQEPVAWLFTNLQSGDYDFCYQEDEHDHDREMWHKQPLYTAPPQLPAEPVQEPVAWIHTDPDKRRVKFLEWRENEPGYRGDWIKTPLYTAPPWGQHEQR